MSTELWNRRFTEILNEKFEKKAQLAEALCNMLHIDRNAAYRRMRNDVPFTASEIMKIASEWKISLDEIIGLESGKISFQMTPVNYLDLSQKDVENLYKMTRAIDHVSHTPNSEYVVVTNNLSRSLAAGFDTLYKLNIYKWGYEYSNDGNNTPFCDVVISNEMKNIAKYYYKTMKEVSTTSFILDSMLFDHVINEVKFFHSILLINDEEKEMIKSDLNALTDYLFEIANTGCYPETKNKVYLYISMFNINTNYSYFYTEHLKVCRIHAFNKYDIASHNPEIVEQFRIWMQLKKRTSMLISEVDTQNRVAYFTKLRQLIETL